MAEIFLEWFAVKRMEKITVRLESLTVGVNSMRTGEQLGRCGGGKGGLLYPLQLHLLGGCLQKRPETRAFDFDLTFFHTYFNDKKVKPGIAKQSYSF